MNFLSVFNMFDLQNWKASKHDQSCTSISAVPELPYHENLGHKPHFPKQGTLVSTLLFGLNKVKYYFPKQHAKSKEMFSHIANFFDELLHSVTPTHEELIALYESIFKQDRSPFHEFAPDWFQCLRHIMKSLIETHDKDCTKLFTKNKQRTFPWIHSKITTQDTYLGDNDDDLETFTLYYALIDVFISHKSFENHVADKERNVLSEACSVLITDLIQTNIRTQHMNQRFMHLNRISTTLLRKVLDSLKFSFFSEEPLIPRIWPIAPIIRSQFNTETGELENVQFTSRIEYAMNGSYDLAVLIIKDLIRKSGSECRQISKLLSMFSYYLFRLSVNAIKSAKTTEEIKEALTVSMKKENPMYELPKEFADLLGHPSTITPCELLRELLTCCDPNAVDINVNCVPLELAVANGNWHEIVDRNIMAPIMELMRCTKPNLKILTTIYGRILNMPIPPPMIARHVALHSEFIKAVIEIMDSSCEFLFEIREGRSVMYDAIICRSVLFLHIVVNHLKYNSTQVNSIVCNKPGSDQDKYTLLIGVLKNIRLCGTRLLDEATNQNILPAYEQLLRKIISIPDVDIEATDELQYTAAYHAVMTLNPNIVSIVIEDGKASVNVKNRYGKDIISAFSQLEGTISGHLEKLNFDDILSCLKYKKGESFIYEGGERHVTPEVIDHQFQKLKSLINSCDGVAEDQQQCVIDFVESAQMTMRNQKYFKKDGPVNEKHRKKLRANWSYLLQEIDETVALCDYFISEDLMTLDMVDRIKQYQGRGDRCRCLLTILYYRCSDRAFQVFCDALRRNCQHHVAEMLEKDLEHFEEPTVAMPSHSPCYSDLYYCPQQFIQNTYAMPIPPFLAYGRNGDIIPALTSAPLLQFGRPSACSNIPTLQLVPQHPMHSSPFARPMETVPQMMEQKEPVSSQFRGTADDTHPKVMSLVDDTKSSTCDYFANPNQTVPKTCCDIVETQTIETLCDNNQQAFPKTCDKDETRTTVMDYGDNGQTVLKTHHNIAETQVNMTTVESMASSEMKPRDKESSQTAELFTNYHSTVKNLGDIKMLSCETALDDGNIKFIDGWYSIWTSHSVPRREGIVET